MKAFRRQRQQYLFGGLLAVIAVINLLFFFILYRPARSESLALQDSISKTRKEIQSRHQKIERLEKLNRQLETSAQDRNRLFTMHFIPINAGWSEIVPKLEAMVRDSGAMSVKKNYTIDKTPQYGLYGVKVKLPVTGSYSSVMDFIKDIENAGTFFIIDAIGVRSSPTTGTAEVTMDLDLETFFYQ
jgi:Tfp pilus assembly protein PilO